MNLLVIAPLIIPLATAIAGLGIRGHRGQQAVAVSGGLLLAIAAGWLTWDVWTNGVQVVQPGDWPAPFGITLVADMLSAIMVTLAGVIGLAAVVYSTNTIDAERQRLGYYPLVFMLLLGVCGAFLTGDLFNLFVWFEVLLISSFVLLVLGGGRPQMEGAIKYVLLNLVASLFFLSAVGLLYAAAGTLNMADLSQKLEGDGTAYVTAVATLLLLAFGIKAAMFPLFFWLPAAYHTAPAPVAAIFAGLLTKVGVYALIRVFTVVFPADTGHVHDVLLWGSIVTMVVGGLGAISHNDIKRILSFHIISQIGYMTLGPALLTPAALAGSILFIGHNIVVKANLFLVAGIIRRTGGTYALPGLGGLMRARPLLAVLFFVPAFSLAGIPPFSGFFAKFALIRATFQAEAYIAGGVALAVGVLTLLSMSKIWSEAFLKPLPAGAVLRPGRIGMTLLLPTAALGILTVVLGVGAEPFFHAANEAAAQLIDRQTYVDAVLGGQR
jgi:multicomponent Na+:H+ antiporter subunit D